MYTQNLKPVQLGRVDTSRANTFYAHARSLGEAGMCPAGAQSLNFDVYGRPANQNTLSINLDAACAQLTPYNVARHLQIENQVRPYTPVASAGMRGPYDTMGRGRDIIPRGLYSADESGRFVRHYPTRNNTPPEIPLEMGQTVYRISQPFDYPHDATVNAQVR